MKVRLWGVRGSIPSPGPTTARYGGNTTCIEVNGDDGEFVILDAGSGIRPLGLDLMSRGPLPEMHLFISHTHWDHIQGFPFFVPCYIPGSKMHIRGPVYFEETMGLRDIFDMQMRYEFFPITNQQLAAEIDYRNIKETTLDINNMVVKTKFTNHPLLCLAYRLEQNGKSFVFGADHEPYHNLFSDGDDAAGNDDADSEEVDPDDAVFDNLEETVDDANARFLEFISGADLVVLDCMYTPDEYRTTKRGWGHASWDFCLDWMKEGNIKKMVLSHHEPVRSDDELDQTLIEVREAATNLGLTPENILMAREGMEFDL